MSESAEQLVFRVHAVQRMVERGISAADVRQVLATGETIEDYPQDTPFPSRLVLGWRQSRPIHVVFADNRQEREIIVVPVYEPDPTLWDADFRRRQR